MLAAGRSKSARGAKGDYVHSVFISTLFMAGVAVAEYDPKYLLPKISYFRIEPTFLQDCLVGLFFV